MEYKDRGNAWRRGTTSSAESTTHGARAGGPGKRTLTMDLAPGPARAIQRKQDSTASSGSVVAEQELPEETQESSGAGQPLPDDVRRKMERALGADFSAVRVHEGPEAQAVGALAFTRGVDIFFAPGQYQPATPQGQELLGHELGHVKQQAQGVVSPTGQAGGAPINNSPSLERDADEQGTKAMKAPDHLAPGASDRGSGNRAPADPMIAASGVPPQETPAPAAATPQKVAGDTKSKKIVRIAWTMDDGPTAVTGDMQKQLAGRPATWYVMRNQIEAGGKPASKLATLKAAQDGGSEIAIHGLHKTESHLAWFPSKAQPSYPSIDAALADLDAFCTQLRGAQINPKFVRLPYGEFTEVSNMLDTLGMHDATARGAVARKILKGESIAANGAIAQTAKAAWDKFVSKIATLGLHNWGGSGPSSPEVSVQSWEAESSGTGLTDDVTSSHGGKVDPTPGKFERLVDTVQEGAPRSLVVLAHDTATKNAGEVGNDIARMESYATSKKVRVEYYTMSQLFTLVRGKKP